MSDKSKDKKMDKDFAKPEKSKGSIKKNENDKSK